jgi:hypothetical protein
MDQLNKAMARRAFQMIKVPGTQNDPDEKVLPTNLTSAHDRVSRQDRSTLQQAARRNPVQSRSVRLYEPRRWLTKRNG